MVGIDDPVALRTWLEGKPHSWAQSLSVRAAILALPFSINSRTSDVWIETHVLNLLRGLFIAWSSVAVPVKNFKSSANAVEKVLYQIALTPEPSAYLASAIRSACSSIIQSQMADIAQSSVRSLSASRNCFSIESTNFELFDNSINSDIRYLIDQNKMQKESHSLIFSHFKFSKSKEFQEQFYLFEHKILNIDSGFDVWIEWLAKRFAGGKELFPIVKYAHSKSEEREIVRNIVQSSNSFWIEKPNAINKKISDWIKSPEVNVSADDGFDSDIPAQNRNAISFLSNSNGQIAIDASALTDRLRSDVGAKDRHAEAVAEARFILERCRGSNAGARLTRLLENYLDAAGDEIEDVKPSLLVQRGERLRQELTAHAEPDNFLAPLSDDLLLDMKGWQSAHNMMVGLDPVLNAMDTAILGPDRQPSLMPPDEIRQKSEAADEAGILADNVAEVLIEAADLAPTIPDTNDRRTILSNEMMRNLIIEAFSVAMNNSKKAVVGIVITGVAVSAMPAGATLLGAGGGAMAAAGFLVREREWIEKQMGNTPAWRDLFLHVSKLIEEKTHFKPKSSDKSE